MKELIVPERVSLSDIIFDFRVTVLTKSIETRLTALDMLKSIREHGEEIVLFYHPQTVHGLSVVSLAAVATPTQIIDFIAAGYEQPPTGEFYEGLG